MTTRVCVIHQAIVHVMLDVQSREGASFKNPTGPSDEPEVQACRVGGSGALYSLASATNKSTTSTSTRKTAVAPDRPTHKT